MSLGMMRTFSETTPKARSIKEIIKELNFIKIKNFCCARSTAKRMRRQATDWEKIFAKGISDKELLSKICKESLKIQQEGKQSNLKMGQRYKKTLHQERYTDGK